MVYYLSHLLSTQREYHRVFLLSRTHTHNTKGLYTNRLCLITFSLVEEWMNNLTVASLISVTHTNFLFCSTSATMLSSVCTYISICQSDFRNRWCFCTMHRNCICSLRLCVQGSSSAVSVHLEAAWIRSAVSDGDEDLDGSWRDDEQSARGTRSSFSCETTDCFVCGKRHYEHGVWSSIWSLRFSIPAADIRCQHCYGELYADSRDISYSAFSPIL